MIIHINGDTLHCKVLKLAAGKINVQESGIEREINTEFVNKMVLQNGKQTIFRPIPATLDFGKISL